MAIITCSLLASANNDRQIYYAILDEVQYLFTLVLQQKNPGIILKIAFGETYSI